MPPSRHDERRDSAIGGSFDTATMFVLMVLTVGLNSLIDYAERRVAPWQAEIAGRDTE